MKGTWASEGTAGATGQKFGIGNAAVGIEYFHNFHYASIRDKTQNNQTIVDACGFSSGVDAYAAPVIMNQNLNTIAPGATTTGGTNVQGPSNRGVEDDYVQTT